MRETDRAHRRQQADRGGQRQRCDLVAPEEVDLPQRGPEPAAELVDAGVRQAGAALER